jgi:hypothetical protein
MNDPYEDDMKAFHEKVKQERLAQSYDQQLQDHIVELEAKYETAKSAYSDLLVNSMNEAGQSRVRIKELEAQLKDVRECEVISTQDYLDMEVMRVTDVLTAAKESK